MPGLPSTRMNWNGCSWNCTTTGKGWRFWKREMAEAYNARSAELKALDKARSADPGWYKRGDMFGMTMYTDLFAGNLKELAEKIPYLKEQKLDLPALDAAA